MCEVENGNIFLISNTRAYSSFNRAERNLLGDIRKSVSKQPNQCGFLNITCIQLDTCAKVITTYDYTTKLKGNKLLLTIQRDKKNNNGCRKKLIEELNLNLDYV